MIGRSLNAFIVTALSLPPAVQVVASDHVLDSGEVSLRWRNEHQALTTTGRRLSLGDMARWCVDRTVPDEAPELAGQLSQVPLFQGLDAAVQARVRSLARTKAI